MNNNIAEIRRSLRMKQMELAALLNITLPSLSTLENKAEIEDKSVFKVAKVLNTTKKRIFNFSDRARNKPSFNPHMEAFLTQGYQANKKLGAASSIVYADRLLSSLHKADQVSIAPIRDIFYLGLFDLYCLTDYINDQDTTETLSILELMFACGLIDAEFYLPAALLDNRTDIIQSFFNGIANINEKRGGKEEYNNLRLIRDQSGLTREKLSQISGVSTQVIRGVEGSSRCSDTHLKSAKKLAKALDCEFVDLFSDTPKDIYNLQAKKAGVELRKEFSTLELQSALERDMNSVEMSVRDILAFLNCEHAKREGILSAISFSLIG